MTAALAPLAPDELLTTTRSVRRRLDLERPVPLELVRDCISVALQAPTGGNRQDWHWIVLTDPERRAGVADLYRRAFESYRDSPAFAGRAFADDPARAPTQRRVGSSAVYLAERMAEVPVLVLACMAVGPAGLPEGNQAGLWGSLLPAAWSYMLAARARGLGTAWTTLHLAYEREVAALLGIPDDVRQGVLIPTAFSVGTDFHPARRQPLEDVLHLDGW